VQLLLSARGALLHLFIVQGALVLLQLNALC
jgi:hypothetical protein